MNIVRIFIALYFLAFLFTGNAIAFNDLKADHPYNEAINFIKDNGIVQGYPDGSFRPESQINRAEFLKIIVESKFSDTEIENALKEDKIENYNYADFIDIPINEWYAPYIRIAVREGLIKGYPDGTFRPEGNVNFVEALKIILKVSDIIYDDTTSPWYRGSVEKASELNLISSDITSFSLNITRAQMADLITRAIKFQEGDLNNYLGDKENIKWTYEDIKSSESPVVDNGGVDFEACPDEVIDCISYNISLSSVDENSLGFDCFVEASKNCCPARVIASSTNETHGVNSYNRTYREIKGLDGDQCIYYTRIDFYEFVISEVNALDIIHEDLSNQESIENLRKKQEKFAQSMIGKESTCKYPILDLTKMLENEKRTPLFYSPVDTVEYECIGSMYEEIN
jgi:hypothetical protein